MADFSWIPDGSIDVAYLRQKPAAQRSAFEERVLGLAKCDGDTLLELSDFSSAANCYQPSIDQFRPDADRAEVFRFYRGKVVAQMLRTFAPNLSKAWPDLDVAKLATLVDRYATGVTDVAAMLPRLERVLLARRDTFTASGIMVFCLPWLIMYNLDATQKERVQRTQPSILPSEAADFPAKSLRWLEQGVVQIGLMNQHEATAHVALYDADHDMIALRKDLQQNPLYEHPQKLLEGTLPHEFWHAYQDAHRGQLSRVEAEVEAYLIGYKSLIAMRGESLARSTLPTSPDLTPLQQVKAMPSEQFQKVLGLALDSVMNHADDEAANLREALNPWPRFFEAARRELRWGREDGRERRRLQRLYVQFDLIRGMLLTGVFTAGLHYEELQAKLGKQAFQQRIRERFSALPTPGKIKRLQFQHRALTNRNIGSFGDDFTRAVLEQIDHFALIYFISGESAAITFVKNELLPAVLAPHVMREALQVRMVCDGLAREE